MLDLQSLNELLSTAYLGPILSRVFFEMTGLVKEGFDPYGHATHFISGYANITRRPPGRPRDKEMPEDIHDERPIPFPPEVDDERPIPVDPEPSRPAGRRAV